MAPHSASGRTLRRQAGFGYLLVLLLIVLMGIGLGAAGTLWHTESQRVKESELLYVGEEYRKAIRSYSAAPDPNPGKHYPKSLNDLLLDPRQTQLTRHLRKLYPDPMTGKKEWGMIMDADTQEIRGVYSLAPGQPLKQQGFDLRQMGFGEAESYDAWRFAVTEAVPSAQTAPKIAAPTPADTPNPPSDTDN